MHELKLLIIEDDLDQRELIAGTIEAHFGRGSVVAVGSFAEAMHQPFGQFDLILSDYNLPDGGGMEVIDAVRAVCDTPVILVTGENHGATAAEAIRRGATDYIVKVGDYLFTIPLAVEKNLTTAKIKRENEELRRRLEHALADVRGKNQQLEQSLRRVEELAATDELTGLYNRRHFARVSEQLFADAYRSGGDLACVMIDMDRFKQLNDTRGHQAGDAMLALAGKVIAANLRKMDVAARYGGDEFVILLPHTDAQAATTVAQRIADEFQRSSAARLNNPGGMSMSIGCATLKHHRPSGAEQLVGFADAAMYRAKQTGKLVETKRVGTTDEHR